MTLMDSILPHTTVNIMKAKIKNEQIKAAATQRAKSDWSQTKLYVYVSLSSCDSLVVTATIGYDYQNQFNWSFTLQRCIYIRLDIFVCWLPSPNDCFAVVSLVSIVSSVVDVFPWMCCSQQCGRRPTDQNLNGQLALQFIGGIYRSQAKFHLSTDERHNQRKRKPLR